MASLPRCSDLYCAPIAPSQVKNEEATAMRSLSMLRRLATRNRYTVAVSALLTLIIAGAMKLGTVLLLLHLGVGCRVLQAQDALITGILAACFVWVLSAVERARRREEENQVYIFAELNHDVRNALDVIVCSEYLGTGRATAVLESVERINRALITINEAIPQEPADGEGLR
jgi:hypothetical protein